MGKTPVHVPGLRNPKCKATRSMDNHGFQGQDWRIGKSVAQCNKHMLENQLHCDVTFIVGEERNRISAHKYTLISRSEVFEAMFTGLLHEHSDEIEIPDVSPASFWKLLEYIYYDNTRIEEQETYELLYVARKYLVLDLVQRCLQRLKTKMSIDNVCLILSYADDEGTVQLCLTFIYRYPLEVLKSDGFKSLSVENVKRIISSDKLSVKEEDVFDAIIAWSAQECLRQGIDVLPENQATVSSDILKLVRYGRMDKHYLLNVCKQFLPIDFYTEVIENIALESENNLLQTEGQAGANAMETNFQTRHPGGACGLEASNFPRHNPREVLDSARDLTIDCDEASDELVNSRDLTPSVFTPQNDRFGICRFGNSIASGKSYDGQTQDSISFITSENVKLVGVSIFGSCGDLGVYQIHLEIHQDLGSNLSLVHSSEHHIETDGTSRHYTLKLSPSLHIEKDHVYTIRALIRGPPSYFGTNGKSEFRRNGVSIWFITDDDGFGLNSTTADMGQFSGLIFDKPV